MSTLDPSSGFFDRVTNCHFGSGNWFSISAGQEILPFTTRVDFPDIHEGSPGITMFSGTTPNPQFHLNPTTTDPAWLTGKLTTSAGAKLTGFGTGFDGSRVGGLIHVPGAGVAISMDKFSPTKVTRVVFSIVGNDHGDFAVNVFTFRKVSAQSLFTDVVDVKGALDNATFRIDPKTLLITVS